MTTTVMILCGVVIASCLAWAVLMLAAPAGPVEVQDWEVTPE